MEPSSDRGAERVLRAGRYTVVLPDAGHRTLEVTRAGPEFRAGPFIVSYPYGPDNENGHRALGHIAGAGDGRLSQACWRARPSPRWWPISRQRANDGGAGPSSMRPAVRSMRRCRDV